MLSSPIQIPVGCGWGALETKICCLFRDPYQPLKAFLPGLNELPWGFDTELVCLVGKMGFFRDQFYTTPPPHRLFGTVGLLDGWRNVGLFSTPDILLS